ncbi:MAG: alpha/beta hydrolase [Bacteroidia bacterium]|nr:alpha/beta hydrolase [Bacteroidia bacterium]
MYKLLKQPFFGRFMVHWANPLSPEQQAEWNSLRISSRSGASLQVLYAQAQTPEPRAVIVLGHPMGKEAKGYFLKTPYPAQLRAAGYHVLVFDFNGFGESGMGSFSFFEDVVAATRAAGELFPDLPVGYHGVSLGGMWATIAFADPLHPIDFAIVESAAVSLPEFWKHFPVARQALAVMRVLMPGYARKIHMVERIREARGLKQLLLIYTEADEWIPASAGAQFRERSPVPAELWTVPDAKHAQIHRSAHQAAYYDRIFRFFEAGVLACRPGLG